MTERNSRKVKRKLSVSSQSPTISSSSISPSPPPYDDFQNMSPSSTHKTTTDDDLVSAAEALTQLTKSVTPPPNNGSHVTLSSEKQISNSGSGYSNQHPLITKVSKVTKHPIVTNAVKYYESSKRNYAPFNYAAGIVEKAAIPVVNKIEVNLNNRYQAKQLKLETAAATAASVDSNNQKMKKRRLFSGDEEKIECLSDRNKVVIETKKRLQFCLHILRLANDHINNKVNLLQQKVLDKEREIKVQRENELQQQQAQQQSENGAIPNETAQQTKTEIITTVKKIIHLISNFKPSSLSTNNLSPVSSATSDQSENLELKSTIRDIILKLPSTIQQNSITNSTSAQQANDKVFVFAKESLEMITRLTNVFNDQLEKAESWVSGEEAIKMEESKIDLKADDIN